MIQKLRDLLQQHAFNSAISQLTEEEKDAAARLGRQQRRTINLLMNQYNYTQKDAMDMCCFATYQIQKVMREDASFVSDLEAKVKEAHEYLSRKQNQSEN